MNVLVTGGRGFIGRYVINELVGRGYEPVAFDRMDRRHVGHDSILGDVRDATAVTEAVAHTDAVIHLAAVLGTQETIANPLPAAETNILGSLNVFQAVAQYEVPAVYICVGNYWMQNTYSITKTAAERFAWMFNLYRGTRIAPVRALNAYGPGQALPQPWGPSKVRKIMPTFCAQALTNNPIEIYGDGTQVMDMVYVTDVARVLVDALEAGPHPDGLTYEVGSGVPTSVAQIANEVADQAGSDQNHTYLPMRPGEPERSVVLADLDTLEPLGTQVFVPLREGVKAALADVATRL